MSSESKLCITEPCDYQCHEIDVMIDRSNEAIGFQTQAIIANEKQTVIQANKEALQRIEYFPDQLEEFRTAIENVRTWGSEWKTLAKSLLEKYEPERLNPTLPDDLDIPF